MLYKVVVDLMERDFVHANTHPRAALLAAVPLALMTSAAQAYDFSAHGPDNTFSYVLGSGPANGVRWPDSTVRWYYNPASQPAGLSTETVVATVQRAMQRWTDVCNVRFAYQGTTTAAANLDATFSTTDRVPVVAWAPLTGARSSFSGYTSYWWSNGTMIDADIVLNTARNPPFGAGSVFDLEALLAHEVGHMIGIQHSDIQQSVMYANPYNTYKFQRTLRGDDVAACVAMYGASVESAANRVFNWAEVTYERFFAPVGGITTQIAGYQVRSYSETGSYLGAKDGTIYILLNGGTVTAVGGVSDFLPAATQAGF